MEILCRNQGSDVDLWGLVFDIDNTVYPNHRDYLKTGSQGEVQEVARLLGQSPSETEVLINQTRLAISDEKNREATLTETVYQLGITQHQWSELRCRVWQPEAWLSPDKAICDLFRQLRRYRVAFGTNSPLAVGQRILKVIGISEALPQAQVFGPENLGVSKPDPDFFLPIAKKLGLNPGCCFSAGDRKVSDVLPAMQAGYAGAAVTDYTGLTKILPLLANSSSLAELIRLREG